MKMKEKLNGYYNYTVILTYLGMLFGFTGIVYITEGEHSLAIICLMIAGVCDMFDGAGAATKQRDINEKRFGIQIDSLSDLICFGILPALITYFLCGRSEFAFLSGCLYVLCALIRLAYFNVLEEERQTKESGTRRAYQGLPVTASALILPVVYTVTRIYFRGKIFVMPTVLILMAIAFVSPLKVKKPHFVEKMAIILAGILEFGVLLLGLGDV